mmetsp:Transcript_20394/g.54578  ORF Transcript_20394/g.54578 Transcript_20394/m.54578 type:complete len:312 (-) Transcript_20394:1660-2595(-)
MEEYSGHDGVVLLILGAIVLYVADKRMANESHVHTDLVRPSSENSHLHEGEPTLLAPEAGETLRRHAEVPQSLVLCDGRHPLTRTYHAAKLTPGKVLPFLHGHIDQPNAWRILSELSFDQRKVFLLHAMRSVLHSEMPEGLPRLSEDLYTTRVAVEPMTDPSLPRLVLARHREALVCHVDEIRWGLFPQALWTRHHKHTSRLGHCHEVVRLSDLLHVPPLVGDGRSLSETGSWRQRKVKTERLGIAPPPEESLFKVLVVPECAFFFGVRLHLNFLCSVPLLDELQVLCLLGKLHGSQLEKFFVTELSARPL